MGRCSCGVFLCCRVSEGRPERIRDGRSASTCRLAVPEDGQTLTELNPLFLRHAQQGGFYSDRLVQDLLARGSLAGLDAVPPVARDLFRTALEIAPEDHLRVQAAFQRHTDNAVAKTVNLPRSATVEEVAAVHRRAWELGLKGVTVYRYGSKGEQVLQLGAGETPAEREHFARCDPHACKL
jgi:ribonucleoside-diphosphate reductase alpha chain